MNNDYLNTEQKYQTIPKNKNPYLPPLPLKRPNYHYKTPNLNIFNHNNNYFLNTPQKLSKSFSASNFD